MPLNTAFLLMVQYGGRAIIPIEDVRRDYFDHMSPEKMTRKVATGQLPLPVIRSERSQKAWKGVHIVDLANYLDKQRERALDEFDKMNRMERRCDVDRRFCLSHSHRISPIAPTIACDYS